MLSLRDLFWLIALFAMTVIYFTTGDIEHMEKFEANQPAQSFVKLVWDTVRSTIRSLTGSCPKPFSPSRR